MSKPELTIWGTPKSPRILHFANKVTPEFDKLIRKHASQAKCMITEVLERYQEAYIFVNSGKLQCFNCSSKIKKLDEQCGVLCATCVK
jgi:hypothetical protein